MADHRAALQWIDDQLPALRDELVALCAINSGSFNAAGVAAVADRLQGRYTALGAQAERLDLAPYRHTADDGQRRERAIGPALRLRQRPQAPLQVFLGGHLDTVYAADSPFQHTVACADDRLNGPGVADLKGGLLVMWAALAALERSPWRERIGWTVLLNPDEEIGSPGSAPLLAEAAGRHRFGLVYEPAYADGGLASARKGSGNFDLVVHGRAAHAGRNPEEGRNAIVACAELVAAIHALDGQQPGVTLNPGYVRGGGALNIVPALCVFKFNVRTSAAADEDWLRGRLDELLARFNARDGYRVELHGGFTRPPKPFDARHRHLAGLLQDCGRALDLDLSFRPTGGCCDGNNLAALGLPNLDNLGVVGGDIHSEREWMRVSSLTERAKLSALLLLRLAAGERSPP